MNTACARNQYTHTSDRPTSVHSIHMRTHMDRHMVAWWEDGQNPRIQGGFLMTLLDFVFPLHIMSASIFDSPFICLAHREAYSVRHCHLYATMWDETCSRVLVGWLLILGASLKVFSSLSLFLSLFLHPSILLQFCCSWPMMHFPGTWCWLCPTYWHCLR